MPSRLLLFLTLLGLSLPATLLAADGVGTLADPIVDSRMTEAEAFDGLSADCPKALRDRQKIVEVVYWGFDARVHRGQLIVDQDLVKDITEIFAIALENRFPIQSVIPASHPKFRVKGAWDDDTMMAADNTSGFNYRAITGGGRLSNHALGRAVDINTFHNPYIKGSKILPPGAQYEPGKLGTLTADHPVTRAFLARGWSWGGDWTALKDYQHFEKAAPKTVSIAYPGWLKPRALKPGDTIAFVAPAGPVDMAPLHKYAARLELDGYHVMVPESIGRKANGYLAGTDDQRADELNAMIRDPKVRGIFAARGGYGLTRILDRIDYDALRADPKVITGYSDITALHLAIAARAQVVSFHSPMPMSSLWHQDTPELAFSAQSFRQTVLADSKARLVSGGNIATPDFARPEKLVGGRAQGRLLGGNLSLITSTLGTPYALNGEGIILFIEDVHEAPYRVDRMLSQLRLAGVFDRVAGVILGSFTSDNPAEAAELDRVLRDACGGLKVPVLWRFPVGHNPLNATMPEGVRVELDANAGTVKLLEDPVRLD